ncbi:MAG: SMC-Scp complex subunit ScpB [Nitrospiraceae bacterium]|nr:MAG: SMC-Scp complex subunit ScpB [Nitrospiraceae bacterium]
MEDKEAKSVIESLLFIAGEPLSLDALKNILEIDRGEIERLVRELVNDYTLNNTGLLVAEVAEGVQMVTNPACAPWVKKLLSTAVPAKLSQPSLETLAIIAYKQPIIKAEIEAIRGVNSDGVVKTLLDRKLVKILGRKEVPGRPLMYGTTKEFLQYFGLKDLSEMPTLKEFQEFDMPEAPEQAPAETEYQEYSEEGHTAETQSSEAEEGEVHSPESERSEEHN